MLLPYAESAFASPADAQRYGRGLAERLKKIHGREHCKAVLDELASNKFDPDVTAAFFAALGAKRSRMLPLEVDHGGSGKNSEIDDISDAFGTAVSAGAGVPGFARVSQAMADDSIGGDDVRGLAKLVSHGSFPSDWLANVVRRQAVEPVLDPVLNDRERRVAARERSLGAFMHALGNNPAAARLAIGGDYAIPKIPILDYVDFGGSGSPILGPEDRLAQRLRDLSSAVVDSPSDSREMGRAFASASGAYDESDGKHSTEAAWFAYSVMKNMVVSRPLPTSVRPDCPKR